MTITITPEEKQRFEQDGFLVLKDLLTADETTHLRQWAQEVHDWPNDVTSPWMAYAEINADGKQVLCRTENYAAFHQGLNGLLRGEKLLGVLKDLSGENMTLFKEKINYKLAGSGGFAPHLDSTAYTHVKKIQHLSVLLAVDPSNLTNGGLEVVRGSHKMEVPIGEDNCLEPAWVKQQEWMPVELQAGEVLIFGSYVAHRSGPNKSSADRKALYATYNRASEGELHDAYYIQRRVEYPPTHLRQASQKFAVGSLRYGFGSPMMSVDAGRQLAF